MHTKRCHMCKLEKSIDQFTINKRQKYGVGCRCKDCQKILSKQHYQNNKDKYRQHLIKARIKLKTWLNNYKRQARCKYCNEEEPVCLDFHHRNPETKIGNISEMFRTRCYMF